MIRSRTLSVPEIGDITVQSSSLDAWIPIYWSTSSFVTADCSLTTAISFRPNSPAPFLQSTVLGSVSSLLDHCITCDHLPSRTQGIRSSTGADLSRGVDLFPHHRLLCPLLWDQSVSLKLAMCTCWTSLVQLCSEQTGFCAYMPTDLSWTVSRGFPMCHARHGFLHIFTLTTMEASLVRSTKASFTVQLPLPTLCIPVWKFHGCTWLKLSCTHLGS